MLLNISEDQWPTNRGEFIYFIFYAFVHPGNGVLIFDSLFYLSLKWKQIKVTLSIF